jgi:hypothetical protein
MAVTDQSEATRSRIAQRASGVDPGPIARAPVVREPAGLVAPVAGVSAQVAPASPTETAPSAAVPASAPTPAVPTTPSSRPGAAVRAPVSGDAKLASNFAALKLLQERMHARRPIPGQASTQARGEPPAQAGPGSATAAAEEAARPARGREVFAQTNRAALVQRGAALLAGCAEYFNFSPEERAEHRARLGELDVEALERAIAAWLVVSDYVALMTNEARARRAAIEADPKRRAFFARYSWRAEDSAR